MYGARTLYAVHCILFVGPSYKSCATVSAVAAHGESHWLNAILLPLMSPLFFFLALSELFPPRSCVPNYNSTDRTLHNFKRQLNETNIYCKMYTVAIKSNEKKVKTYIIFMFNTMIYWIFFFFHLQRIAVAAVVVLFFLSLLFLLFLATHSYHLHRIASHRCVCVCVRYCVVLIVNCVLFALLTLIQCTWLANVFSRVVSFFLSFFIFFALTNLLTATNLLRAYTHKSFSQKPS